MQIARKEEKPVIYSPSATKILRFERGQGIECFNMHWHERFEIIIVQSGALEYILGGKKGVAYKNEVLIIPPRMAHFARALESVVYDVLMFDVRSFYNDTEVAKNLLSLMFEGRFDFVEKTDNAELFSLVDRLCNKTDRDSLGLVSGIYLFLDMLIKNGFAKKTECKSSAQMREVTDYIEKNFDKELTTAILCDRFGYTPAHFCRKFKKATGLTPVTYIKIYRLEQAYKMLKQGDGQVFEIADRCGFLDTNYFTRCFKAHYKQPPTYFKKGENV